MSTTSPTRRGSDHPTRPATPAQLEWLRSEVADWQREGVVDDLQAGAILRRYHAARRLSLARLLLGLGATFVGFGVIWLVAANLDQLPPTARFLAVAVTWVVATVGAELLAARRAHGGPIPSPVVHAARLLAALLLGGVVFQAAQSLQVPAYEPRLVGVWSLGALAHGYVVRAVAPVAVGIVAGFAWVVWDAVWAGLSAPSVLLSVAAAGVIGASIAAVHDAVADPPRDSAAPADDDRWWTRLSDPWRQAAALTALGVLFVAALPFPQSEPIDWRLPLVLELLLAGVLLTAAVALGVRPGTPRLLWAEPLGALAVAGLSMLLVLWEAGADADDLGAAGWSHAIVAVAAYLLVATGVAVVGILRDRGALTITALCALVLFTTVQSFAVFARIIEGAWLFLVVGLVLGVTGYAADRARRRLAASLDDPGHAVDGGDR